MCSAWLLVLTTWFKLDFDSDPATKQNKPKTADEIHRHGPRNGFNSYLSRVTFYDISAIW